MAALFSWIATEQPASPTSLPMVVNIVDMLFEGIAGPQYGAQETTSKEGT